MYCVNSYVLEVVVEGVLCVMCIFMNCEFENLEMYILFFGMVGFISLYIGLFGMVWGIMYVFIVFGVVK